MSTNPTQETHAVLADKLLERADKWLRLLDTKEYILDQQKAVLMKMVPDTQGKHPAFMFLARPTRFVELLSRAMTNFQSIDELYGNLISNVSRGLPAIDIRTAAAKGIDARTLKELIKLNKDPRLSKVSDTTFVLVIKEGRDKWARAFLYYVDLGLTSGTIVEGEALRRKFNESEQERHRLEEECDRYAEELINLKGQLDECQRKLHFRPLREGDPLGGN